MPDLADAIADLALAIWALAAAFEDPNAREQPYRLALRAAERASDATARHADRTLIEIAGQVRSTAADLVRASQAGAPDDAALAEASTEEMLAQPPPAAPTDPGGSTQDAGP